jgi:glucosamine--fructose-6-phosphate aminotransferase (isomerizing)
MCGIVGYVGPQQAAPLLLQGLSRLEYRGYDSAGLAVVGTEGAGRLQVRKLAGRISALASLVTELPVAGACGIAHTRWATHGAPSQRNAHPHCDCRHELALVHNGVIENADVLRERLEWAGHDFVTETDTEALVHLIEEAPGETLEARVLAALEHIEGTYGLAVVAAAEPDKVVVARQGTPMLIGIPAQGTGMFVASDPAAILEHTRSVVHLNDGDVAVLRPGGYELFDAESRPRVPQVSDIASDLVALELGGYPHFMLKEIHEQPDTTRATLRGRLLFDEGSARLDGLNLSASALAGVRRIVLLGCSSSWHAALVGRDIIESLAEVPVQVEYASEYRYRRALRQPGTLAIAISQSGETGDTLEAMRAARVAGARVFGIVNVVGSSIAREADGVIYLHAGPEIGVASTKAFTSQLLALTLFGLYLGRKRDMSPAEGRELACHLAALPGLVAETLTLEPQIRTLAAEFAGAGSCVCLGRGANLPIALEGALKLKEISRLHAEGYPGAEMKHGPMALIDSNMVVVVVVPRDAMYAKTLSDMQQVRARDGRIVAITSRDSGGGDLGRLVDHQVRVPAVTPLLSPVLTVIPLQLLAYHIAVLRGCEVDNPRHLAKSYSLE